MKKILYISLLLFTAFSCTDDKNINGPENELYPHKYVFDRIKYTPEKVDFVLQSDGFQRVGDWNYETTYDTSFTYYDYKSELTWFSLAFVDESKVDILLDDTVNKDSVRSHYLIDDKYVHVLDEEVPTEIDTFYTLKYNDDKTELSNTFLVATYLNGGIGWGDELLDGSVDDYLDMVLDTAQVGDTVVIWTFESVMKRID